MYTRDLGGGRRLIYGRFDKHAMPGMTREARLTIDALVKLARVAFLGSATSESADDDLSESNRSNSRQATGSHGVEDG